MRRWFPVCLAFALAIFTAPAALAQGFPNGPVRIVVPFPPGGATDVLGRIVAQHLQILWGQTVVVENKPGAAGLIGAKQVMTSPPDGLTLLMASTGTNLATAPAIAAANNGRYDVTLELAPVSLVAAPPYILVVNPSVPAKTTAELIAYAKQNPGKLSFGSSGVGSASHLSGALFQNMAGVDIVHVPYRGTGPAVTDLLGGRIEMMFSPAPVVSEHIAAGSLRAIGTTALARSALFPNIPTVAETGLPGYDSLGWFGLFAPPKTPDEIVGKISADVAKVLAIPEVKQRLAEQGAEPAANKPAVFVDFINKDVTKWLDLSAKTGIKLSN